VEAKFVGAELVGKHESLKGNLDGIRENLRNLQEQQRILQKSSNNLQETIKQLLSIQSQSIEKNFDFPKEDKQTLVESQKLFLETNSPTA